MTSSVGQNIVAFLLQLDLGANVIVMVSPFNLAATECLFPGPSIVERECLLFCTTAHVLSKYYEVLGTLLPPWPNKRTKLSSSSQQPAPT